MPTPDPKWSAWSADHTIARVSEVVAMMDEMGWTADRMDQTRPETAATDSRSPRWSAWSAWSADRGSSQRLATRVGHAVKSR